MVIRGSAVLGGVRGCQGVLGMLGVLGVLVLIRVFCDLEPLINRFFLFLTSSQDCRIFDLKSLSYLEDKFSLKTITL